MGETKDDAHAPLAGLSSELITRPLDRAPSRYFPQLHIRILSGPDAGVVHAAQRERIVVGTHPSADLRLTDSTVSRFHAELEVLSDRVVIRDLESRNGTFVDGVRIERAVLHPEAVIAVGQTQCRPELPGDRVAVSVSDGSRFGTLIGDSIPMRRVFAALERAAESEATVLLSGETGTGKEAAAESLHEASPRAAGPFVVVDCAAIPANLLESELFGHERGAFTGATAARTGCFEAASGGTVFLDEIGELPIDLQPKLLRVLEKRQVKRLGATAYQPVDVRIVSATNRDLKAEVNARHFRSDLYYRIAVVEVRLPALRERPEDIPSLVDHLLGGLGLREHAKALRSPQQLAQMSRYPWPGNVRELRNYLERCAALRRAVVLEDGDANASSDVEQLDSSRSYSEARRHWNASFESRYLRELLAAHSNNVSAAARAAKIDRAQLYRLLWRHGLRGPK